MHLAFFVLSKQLSESEESDGEAENKKEKKAALSSGRKYIPPKIAAVHYGNVLTFFWFLYSLKRWVSVELKLFENSTWTWSLPCLFREFRKHSTAQTLISLKPFPPDGDMTEADKKAAQVERQRRAALRSSVIQELRQQYSDAPEEIRERRDFQNERESREELHRCVPANFIRAARHTGCSGDQDLTVWDLMVSITNVWHCWHLCRKNYEESMMVRLNMPKHQKNAKKRGMMGMSNQLSGITHFSDITALTGGDGGQVSDRETSLGRRPGKECEAPSRPS